MARPSSTIKEFSSSASTAKLGPGGVSGRRVITADPCNISGTRSSSQPSDSLEAAEGFPRAGTGLILNPSSTQAQRLSAGGNLGSVQTSLVFTAGGYYDN